MNVPGLPVIGTFLCAARFLQGSCKKSKKESWAVIGTEDRVIPPATQRSMAERAGSTITEVAASHVSMVSHPEAAIAAIQAAAAAVGD